MKQRLHNIFTFLINNVVVNNFLLYSGLEKYFIAYKHHYRKHRTNPAKSRQEIAGFSVRPEINECLEKAHADLKKLASKISKGTVLEIGCGPGLYLQDFDPDLFELHALDLSPEMIKIAQQHVPSCSFYHTNFLAFEANNQFDLIYSVGVLMYFPKSQIRSVFQKIHLLLKPGGYAFIHYPHAINLMDLFYRDSKYVQYSPAFLEKICTGKFKISEHHQALDGRKITNYDPRPYKSLNPGQKKTYKNSYLLIIQKI